MMKQSVKLAYLLWICIAAFSHAATDLRWEKNFAPINEITLGINEFITVQLRDTDPVISQYDLTLLNASPAVDITSVTPLLGNLSYASEGSDSWLLHYAWDMGQPVPISDWFEHWDVTIQGLEPGSYSYDCGGSGEYSILHVTVVPLPSTLFLLSSGLLFMRPMKKRPG